jgi:hypothetical protein
MAAEAARKALRDSRLAGGGRPPGDEELVDAVQAAILGSILPVVSEAGVRRNGVRHHGGGSGSLSLLVGVGIGVGIAAWARRDEVGSDRAQDDEWELAGGSSTQAVKATINETLDRADAAIRRGARAMAQTMEAAVGTVADAAGPTAELVTDKLKVARNRATEEVIRTLDGMEDVWDDEPDDGEKPVSTPTPKKPIPRKPIEGKPNPAVSKPASPKPATSRRSRTSKDQ